MAWPADMQSGQVYSVKTQKLYWCCICGAWMGGGAEGEEGGGGRGRRGGGYLYLDLKAHRLPGVEHNGVRDDCNSLTTRANHPTCLWRGVIFFCRCQLFFFLMRQNLRKFKKSAKI